MNPIQAAVRRPYTVAVGVVLLLIFSGLAIERIPVQLKPTVDVPQITVQTTYRGASALEVEEQITRPLEEELQSVQGLVKLTSESGSGRSALTLELELGADTRLALIDVVSKLSRVPNLPDEADEPRVDIASSDESQPVMWVAIPSSYAANRVLRLVQEEIEPHLERVPGVSSLLVVGGSEREVQIQIDPSLLVVYGVTPAELVRAISRGPVNVRGGTVETETRRLVVRTVGKPAAIAGLEEIVIKQTASGRVRLGDVATVIDDYREIESFVSISGTQGVAIGVRRQVGANVVALIKRVDEEMERLNTSFESRGLDMRLQPVYRETTYIDAAMSFVTSSLLLGAALSVVILIVFLRSFRSVIVVAASIPISMISVFLVLSALGRSLNVISLAGIAFASGMAVDNAIVVLENIFRHLEMGKGRLQAAIDGGVEVWGGVLASTLTTVAVFVPIVLQIDEASQLFKDMALAISAAVAFSLVVALTVVPVLSSLLFKGGSEGTIPPASTEAEGKTSLGVIGRLYDRFLIGLTRRSPRALPFKLGFVLVVAAASLACLRLAPPAEYLPTGNRNLVMFFAAPIAGSRAETVQASFRPLEEFLLAQPETERTFCVIASRFNGGGVLLKEEFATPEKLAEFHKRLFGPTSRMSGFRYVVPIRASLFRDPGKQFEVELSGGDLDRLEAAAGELSQRLQGVPGIQFVRSSLVTGNPEIQVVLDEERAKELGLDVTDVGQFVELVVAGRRLTTAVEDGREVDVNVLAAQEAVSSARELEELRFMTASGQQVALGSVARVIQATGPESVRHLERERNVLLTVNLAAEAPLEEVIERVERDVLPGLSRELGPNYNLRVGGSADKLRATLAALSGGFGLSIVIIYLLLVALFRSWLTPAVILVTVPLALSGGLIGIRLAHIYSGGQAAFDVIAMLGFVILAGLVVNNAILIVHQANNFVGEGYEFPRALAESARSRLRPIVMSVVTTVVGMLPLALGSGAGAELYQGLGAIIVGGLLVSTLFTLFLVPVLLSLGNDLRVRLAGAPDPASGEDAALFREPPSTEPAPNEGLL